MPFAESQECVFQRLRGYCVNWCLLSGGNYGNAERKKNLNAYPATLLGEASEWVAMGAFFFFSRVRFYKTKPTVFYSFCRS